MLNLLRDQSVLVLGLGSSGLAMATWAAHNGARRVAVWDSRAAAPQDDQLLQRVPMAERVQGELHAALLDGVGRVFKSPGLSPLDPGLAPFLARAKALGIAIEGELDLFSQALAELQARWRYQPGVLAITGTNGKTTTTVLTGKLCTAAGRRVAVAGNIGPTLLDTLHDALTAEGGVPGLEAAVQAAAQAKAERQAAALVAPPEADVDVNAGADVEPAPGPSPSSPATEGDTATATALDGTDRTEDAEANPAGVSLEQLDAMLDAKGLPIDGPPPMPPRFTALPEVWVLELSSFQLEGVQGFNPSAGAILNLTQDHLDWHGDMAAYGAAKARICGSDSLWVINRDDPAVEALLPQAPPPPMGARGKPLKVVVKWTPPRVCRFGTALPTAAGDFGIWDDGGMAWLVRAVSADDLPVKGKRGRPADEELQWQRLMPADALRIRGRHNAANALAALALATSIGCPLAPMLHALRDYRGEPHRVEWLLTIAGIDFVDDSKGTNVGATVAAISGLAADRARGRLVLVLGGDGKGQDFTPLVEPVRHHARAVALIGRDGPALQGLLADTGVPLQGHPDLPAATRWAFAQAQEGDTVLLSPACASLDMFKNYAHRAEVFGNTVREIAAERGEVV